MARKWLGLLTIATISLGTAASNATAGEEALKKELAALNRITGSEPMSGALKALVDDHKHAKALLAYALPAAQKKELSYNAALMLGLAAAEMKDLKTAEVYLRVCTEKAAKLQSLEKLSQSYGLITDLYFEQKMYADCARVCKELLELNTDDGKDRKVVATYKTDDGEVDFSEPRESFDTARRLRPVIRETYIKAIAKQGKYDQAIKLVDNILKEKDDWIDRHLKGWVLREAGRLTDAATVFEDIIKQVSEDDRLNAKEKDRYIIQFRYEVSNVYVELKKIDLATEHLEFLLKKRPDNPIFYNDLGYIWADHDMKLEEAEKLIRKAIDLDRERRKKDPDFNPKTDHDSGAYLDSLGWVLFKQKKNQEAKDWLLKAIEDKTAQHLEIYDHLGDVHMALGERDLAIKAWQTGIKIASENRRDQERKAAAEKKLAKAQEAK